MMRGTRAVFILAIVLVLVSYPLQWYGTGGAGTPLALNDSRVRAALAFIGKDSWNERLVSQGVASKAWLSKDAHGYKVNLIFQLYGNPWRASVVFSKDNSPLSVSAALSGGQLFPIYLRRVGMALGILWLTVGFLGPRLFGMKCPDCPQSFWSPPLLERHEKTVYGGGFDDEGTSLDPLARRDFVCPRCGYRKITYFIPGGSRPAVIWRTPWSPRPFVLTPKEDERYQQALDKWFDDNTKTTRFHTYEEWKAFYDELKASEREERSL